MAEEIKDTKKDKEEDTKDTETVEETKDKEPNKTESELKLNQELLEANAKITNLQNQIQEKEAAAKETAFNGLLTKNKVKPEFHEFVKFKLKWQDISDLDKAIIDFIKENPALVESVTTGGTTEEKIKTGGEPDSKNSNPLLKYKNENYL